MHKKKLFSDPSDSSWFTSDNFDFSSLDPNGSGTADASGALPLLAAPADLPLNLAEMPGSASLDGPGAQTPSLTVAFAGPTESSAGGWNPPDNNIAAGINDVITVVN